MSDATEDTEDRDGRWTVRGITAEAKNAARMAAKHEHQSVGEWLSRAILSRAGADLTADRVPAVVRQSEPVPVPAGADPIEIERTVAMIRTLSDSGAPVPPAVAKSAYSLLRGRLLTLRRQTKAAESRTI